MGLPLAVLPIFFEIKPLQKKQLSAREMMLVLGFLFLLILGIVNLYTVYQVGREQREEPSGGNPAEDSQEPGGPDGGEGQDGGSDGGGGEDAELSPEELLVREHWEEIRQGKEAYTKEDTEVFESESGSVTFWLYENAGYVYQDLMKSGGFDRMEGAAVPSAKIVILDYLSDQVVYALSSGQNADARYSPGNQNVFYAVIFHDDYDVYVTHPLQVVDGDRYCDVGICLEKKGSRYTSLCQLRLHARDDSGPDGRYYSIVPSDYAGMFSFNKVYDRQTVGYYHRGSPSESGILTWRQGTYFSLNTGYTMDIYLWRGSGSDSEESSHETFDGSVTSSNQVDLYFTFGQEGGGA